MRCFNHHDKDAIGTCKVCSKGLCIDCAADLDHGLACRELHEADVEALQVLTARAARVQAASIQAKYAAPAFYLVAGAIFAGYSWFTGGPGFAIPLGVVFMIYGVIALRANLRAYGKRSPDA